jgi:FkbM family methyltransferase
MMPSVRSIIRRRAEEALTRSAKRTLWRGGYVLFRLRHRRAPANADPLEATSRGVMLRALLDRLAVNCVIDVGANDGGYGRQLRDLGYRGHIVSVEPVPTTFAQLERTVAGDDRWRAHRLALGSDRGVATLHVTRSSNFSSFLQPSTFALDYFAGSAIDREEQVRMERLDDVFGDLTAHVPSPRVLLKTDTQGWDLEVLAGARNSLDRVVALQTEMSVQSVYDGSVSWLEALQIIGGLGFRPANLSTVTRDAALGIVELDGLMVRTGPD